MTVSDCPTQDCVHMGEITAGDRASCACRRIVVQLEGGAAADDGVDLVIG